MTSLAPQNPATELRVHLTTPTNMSTPTPTPLHKPSIFPTSEPRVQTTSPVPIPDKLPIQPSSAYPSLPLNPPQVILTQRSHPVQPRLISSKHSQNTCYISGTNHLAQLVLESKYANHTAALSTTPADAEKNASLSRPLKGPDAKIWEQGSSNKFVRPFPNCVGKHHPPHERIKGSGTIFPIRKFDVPKDQKVTYANFVCNIRLQET